MLRCAIGSRNIRQPEKLGHRVIRRRSKSKPQCRAIRDVTEGSPQRAGNGPAGGLPLGIAPASPQFLASATVSAYVIKAVLFVLTLPGLNLGRNRNRKVEPHAM